MTSTSHIRWEGNGHPGGLLGFVGDLEPWAFQICSTAGDRSRYQLLTALPFIEGGAERPESTDPEALKARAQELLVRFVVSLGAVFLVTTGPQPVTSRCECGGLARHVEKCRWRQGYGSRVIGRENGE